MNTVMAPEKMGKASAVVSHEDDDPTGADGKLMRPIEVRSTHICLGGSSCVCVCVCIFILVYLMIVVGEGRRDDSRWI
jgi:hypothetical protein